MTPDDLKLVSTRELVNELLDRHEHAVFAGIRSVERNGQPKVFTRRKWIGNAATCAGLCSQLDYAINEHADRTSEETDGEDA